MPIKNIKKYFHYKTGAGFGIPQGSCAPLYKDVFQRRTHVATLHEQASSEIRIICNIATWLQECNYRVNRLTFSDRSSTTHSPTSASHLHLLYVKKDGGLVCAFAKFSTLAKTRVESKIGKTLTLFTLFARIKLPSYRRRCPECGDWSAVEGGAKLACVSPCVSAVFRGRNYLGSKIFKTFCGSTGLYVVTTVAVQCDPH